MLCFLCCISSVRLGQGRNVVNFFLSELRKSAVKSTTLAQPFCENQAVGLGDLPQRLHALFVVRQFSHWWALPRFKTMSVKR